MLQKLTAALLALALLSACAREGFYEAVGKTPAGIPSAPEASESEPAEKEKSFVTLDDVVETETAEIHFCVPDTGIEGSAAAAAIDAEIRAMAQKLADSAPEGGTIAVYDGICDNNASFYSAQYEVAAKSSGGAKTTRLFGLTFSAVTGEAVPIDDVLSPDKLAARMLDAEKSTVEAGNTEADAAARAYLTGLGAQKLSGMLEGMTGGFDDGVPECSYSVENGQITVWINSDVAGAVEVRCPDAL